MVLSLKPTLGPKGEKGLFQTRSTNSELSGKVGSLEGALGFYPDPNCAT